MRTLLGYFRIAFLILSPLSLAAQDGVLDTHFGPNSNGILTLIGSRSDPPTNFEELRAVAIQPDKKIVIGGTIDKTTSTRRMYVHRLDGSGIIDPNFNGGEPRIITPEAYAEIQGLAVMGDGSIFYGGSSGSPSSSVMIGATVGRLASSGDAASDLVAPVGPYYGDLTTSVDHLVSSFSYNSTNNNVVLAGGYNSNTEVYKFRSDGTFETSFNGAATPSNQGKISSTNISKVRSVVHLNDGSVLVAGIKAVGVPNFAVAKINSDGTFDNNFGGTGSGVSVNFLLPSTSQYYLEDMVVLPNGKIWACGYANSDFAILRMDADGTNGVIDTTSYDALPGFFSRIFYSMVVQQDNKVIVCGTTGSYAGAVYGVITRYNEDGTLDTGFGPNGNGSIEISDIGFYTSAISTADSSVVLAGIKNLGLGNTQLAVAKIKYIPTKKIEYNILGKDIVSVDTKNTFKINPVKLGNSYQWSYSNNDIYVLGSSTSDSVTLFFNKTTPSGILTCEVSGGGTVLKTVTKNITVSQEPTLAEQLTAPACEPAQAFSDCYINNFNFLQTRLKSVNTGASTTGYADLTASSNYDTLYIGDNYQASVECIRPNEEAIYCGIWIDFDNDGKMAEDKEFVGTAASRSGVFTVNNIYIPTEVEPGPKRVRVRVRQVTPFVASDFCMINGELSETEDYLIVLSNYQALQAPNFITPNNDGKNDQFIVRGAKSGQSNSLKVFNRIGDLVYDKDNYDNSWGGASKDGGQLKPGTYYFVFTQASSENAKDDVVKGFFEIRY